MSKKAKAKKASKKADVSKKDLKKAVKKARKEYKKAEKKAAKKAPKELESPETEVIAEEMEPMEAVEVDEAVFTDTAEGAVETEPAEVDYSVDPHENEAKVSRLSVAVTEAQLAAIDGLCEQYGIAKADAVRRAIDGFFQL